jgi:hypothetical protein
MSDTTYIVLRRTFDATDEGDEPNAYWVVADASVAAADTTAAIRNVAERLGAGSYIAVPGRSFKPVTVTTETKTVLKLEQPDTAA